MTRLLAPLILAGHLVLALAVIVGASAAHASNSVRILAVGDSLVAGFGLADANQDGFVPQMERALRENGHDVSIANAGVSGDTMTGGLNRLEWSLTDDIDAVILALGANDALRGLNPSVTRQALDEMLVILEGRGLPVLVAGMLAPRNLGPEYRSAYDALFSDLAKQHDTVFYPFILEGVAFETTLNQPDGIHPNAEGVAVMVKNMLPFVETLIERVKPD